MLRSSKLVRQALAYGIDRAEIVRALWGALEPRYPPLHSLVHLNTERGYAANWDGYVYRPRRAQGLLERAGCRRGSDGIYVCGRERLSLRLFTTAGTGQRQRTVELVQRQLRRVGVEVVISHAPLSYLDTRDFDAFQFAWIETTGFGHQHIFGCGGFENYSGHCQRIVTADLDQADRILDPARRAAVLNRVDRQLAKDVPVIPLYQIPWVLAYKSSIRNVEASPGNLLGNAENWWLAE
jgi:peptide/nickel transport system substrate-binding protein